MISKARLKYDKLPIESRNKRKCNWEPCGNGYYEVSCSNDLIFDRSFNPNKDKVCRICGMPFDDATYINCTINNRPAIQGEPV